MKKLLAELFLLILVLMSASCSEDIGKKLKGEKMALEKFSSYSNASIEIPFTVKNDGEYALKLNYKNDLKEDWAAVRIEYDDGKYLCSQRLAETDDFSSVYANNILTLSKGKHTVKITSVNHSWLFDSMEILPLNDELLAKITPAKNPVSKNASEKTKALYSYLLSLRGKAILSGQQFSTTQELDAIESVTGKLPAILGLDMMDYSPSRVERGAKGNIIRRAKAYVKSGGIITCCWHWNAPDQLIDEDRPEMRWYDGFRTKATKFDFSKAIKDKNSREYQLIIRDIDAIALQLQALQEADIPVLWRPLHEASGGWFWWGSKGAENYKELYKILFDRLENYHKLNNLIWVWNGQNPKWYPGDEYVDVVSYDTYPGKREYKTFHTELQTVQTASCLPKLCALSENGTMPDVDKLAEEKSVWSWFCTWCGDFVQKEGKYSEEYTDLRTFKKYYENDFLITRDEVNIAD